MENATNMFNEEVRDANQEIKRYIMKRSGKQVEYEPVKIANAIKKACEAGKKDGFLVLDNDQINAIVESISNRVEKAGYAMNVEEIQNMVEKGILHQGEQFDDLRMKYHDYRTLHADKRKKSDLYKKIEGIVEVGIQKDGSVGGTNEEVKQENSNKNPTILSVQRDYIAGEMSRDYTNKYLLPEDIVQAHKDGLIHFHDSDYFAQKMHNCDLINLEDMLQNGTAISGTHIDTPKSFETACTVASQIIAQVASNQYGGQTFTLSHLAPFVDVSRKKIRRQKKEEFKEAGIEYTPEQLEKVVEKEVERAVKTGCQTIQYQLITLQSI